MMFKKYDIFISYAVEDKTSVAAPLAELLKKNGLKVFFAGTELGIGDDIREVIHTGLRQSKFGVVILSPDYNRSWTLGELFNLIDKEVFEKQAVIFPVWHNIIITDVSRAFPGLLNRFALPTSKGTEFIASEITRQVKRKRNKRNNRIMIRAAFLFTLMAVSAMIVPGFQQVSRYKMKDNAVFESLIAGNIRERKSKIVNHLKQEQTKNGGILVAPDTVISSYRHFKRIGSGGYHYYTFRNGIKPVLKSKKSLTIAGIRADETPEQYHNLKEPYAIRIREKLNRKDTVYYGDFVLIDQAEATFKIDSAWRDDQERYHIHVRHINNIQAVRVKYMSWKNQKPKRQHYIDLFGVMPNEEYVFVNTDKQWKIMEIK